MEFFNSNFFIALVTLLVGGVAIFIYVKQRRDSKRDAAKLVLQEIRRAEDVIADYKEHGQYKFTKKIIATNSWAKNIHYFVGDLVIDELDKVSNLYSMGKYLDSIISKISDVKFETNVKVYEESIQRITKAISGETTAATQQVAGVSGQPGQQIMMPVTVQVPVPWKQLLDEITFKYEPIYYSTVGDKLRKIAGIK